jgi:lysophospholipase L1-like esterase
MKTQYRFVTLIACGLSALMACPSVDAEETLPAPPAAKPNPSTQWEKEIAKFEEADKKAFPPADAAVFVGSSSVRLWTTLAEDFKEIPTIRRGFGGSQLRDSVYYADRIVIPYKPRIVVVYAGSNDLAAGRTPEQVLEQFQAFETKVHAALPNTRIAFISVNPSIKRAANDANVRKANALIADYVKGKSYLRFINSFDGLLGPDGQAQKEWLRSDGLHLNAEGYKRWVELVKPAILALYQEAAPKD